MNEIVITDTDFCRFRDYFYQKTGIFFENSKRYFVDKRLLQRIELTEHQSFRGYFTYLRFQASGEELQAVINALTVNETYFFREISQLESLVEEVLDDIVRHRPGELIRIWSMPCSSGEEPYSIVLFLLEHWPKLEQVDIEIIASDIDTGILQKAAQGIFSARSVKNLPNSSLNKYFSLRADGSYQLIDDIRQSVRFTQTNLNNRAEVQKLGAMDVIFCRNLLIYFDDISRRNAVESFYEQLNPGGVLFLGHSESMSRISSIFHVKRFRKSTGYYKPHKGKSDEKSNGR
ncbi:CheR family methyltransferase [Vibrio cholerae]|uniref:Chemotaxis protein methyltransferase 2 n=1 Tax=Vibrio cholerae serotype O1 (strain ATCC 39315 / El Tor Inaba N16961) TaxID=243277 RepID=CHER2_VIBCH|nr:protein-glutamate O-methyltransferase CheR [Vibrio cholerae]Q9KS61.1 RecName: Full=Chemotaxis protein methyltransferase 2 [Vibrio cholerae O1 biovar El Tor str. N16961]AAF94556.1 chemotaxis protein methyltransferase CheR [Vibrio cholerae O1 biovar El Tor str. N16961]ARB80963.1 Chemotaxis protein methyltransferase 2 [Vibrio cholerae]AWA78539.1 Chemotaxis protein methyltransferase [Vibrio cholerae]KFE01702.1 cheR methyltransferase, all-alpha domain protein [Vibrio cholerae]QJS85257.1 protein